MSRILQGHPFRIENTRIAEKHFQKLDVKTSIRIQEAIVELALTGVGDVLMLKPPFDDAWRLRVGNYRVKFDLESGVMTILAIEKREDAYRKRSRKS